VSSSISLVCAAALAASLAPLAGAATATSAGSVTPWQPANISSPKFESHPAIDPRSGDLFFVRSSPSFQGWRIFMSHCEAKGWSVAQPVPFAGDGVEADPYFFDGGKSLYFISTRSTDGIKRKDLDIWRVERSDSGVWQTPQRLPEPVNSTGSEWFPRPASDGWLYFGSDRPGGFGKTDIWRARMDEKQHWAVENLGAAINTAGDEYEPLPAPDGQKLIIMADGGLYESRLKGSSWSAKAALGPEVNVNGSEIGALLSPSGKSLLFSRDIKGTQSGELFLWHIEGGENWPPSCPRS